MMATVELDVGEALRTPMGLVGQAGLVKVQTQDAPGYYDITDQVKRFVEASGVVMGQVVVFSQHTTAPVWVNENEPLLKKDVGKFLARMVPRDADYLHNDFDIRTVNMNEDECPNGHAHIQHGFMGGAGCTIPVIGGTMALGRWQSLFLVELDRARPREVVLQVLGLAEIKNQGNGTGADLPQGPW